MKYVHLRIEKETYDLFWRIKNFYELQDRRKYTISQTIERLINDRITKNFKIPAEQTK